MFVLMAMLVNITSGIVASEPLAVFPNAEACHEAAAKTDPGTGDNHVVGFCVPVQAGDAPQTTQ